jgi:tRNA(adenine34) deaminase
MPKKILGQARLPLFVMSSEVETSPIISPMNETNQLSRDSSTSVGMTDPGAVVPLLMLEPPNDQYFMREALRQAQKAREAGEVPVGAVVVLAGKIIGRAHNQVELLKDATAHAEMLALTQAEAAVGDWRLTDCDLYVTKEPCAMCAGALVHTRIRRVIFGCKDPAAGAAGSVMNLLQMPALNHRCDIASGVLQDECAAILQDFFRKRRDEQIANRKSEIEN